MAKVGAPIIYPVDEVITAVKMYIVRAKAGEVKPRLISFRAEYGIGKTRLWELKKENAELADALDQLQTLEEEYIVNGGETGTIPAPFAKFRLQQNPFNYKDKSEVETTNLNMNASVSEEVAGMTSEQKIEKLKQLHQKYSHLLEDKK